MRYEIETKFLRADEHIDAINAWDMSGSAARCLAVRKSFKKHNPPQALTVTNVTVFSHTVSRAWLLVKDTGLRYQKDLHHHRIMYRRATYALDSLISKPSNLPRVGHVIDVKRYALQSNVIQPVCLRFARFCH